MSYFEDYVEEGLCCEGCGEFLGGDEPGHVRRCATCERAYQDAERQRATKTKPNQP